MKIVGVGLNKTGTKTLAVCLTEWGYDHFTWDLDSFRQYQRGDYESLWKTMRAYDSFEDWPWPLMYREIDSQFPNSKFILTIRQSPEVWFASLCKMAIRLGPLTDFEQYIYGFADPAGHEKEHIDFYLKYNREVKDYFADRPGKLLVVCWETGDGWKELCDHLGFQVPDIPLPHINKTLNWLDKAKRAVKATWRGLNENAFHHKS